MVTKRKVRIPIFNYIMIVIIYDYWEDLKGCIPDELYNDPCKGITIEYDDYCIVVCPHNHISTVVHECGHIANMIWKYIGYTPIRDNDEVDQYLRTYLFEEINKIINKHLSK